MSAEAFLGVLLLIGFAVLVMGAYAESLHNKLVGHINEHRRWMVAAKDVINAQARRIDELEEQGDGR